MLKIVCPRLSSLTRLTSANSNSLFPLSDDEEQEDGLIRISLLKRLNPSFVFLLNIG